ncbi:hypothetical protein [Streptomyces sp. BH104]|uniref:hypothetical protein n=1 Tax=Streptomyces sp. BH104 TaxID=3410407 RepID=UPI003BB6A0A5
MTEYTLLEENHNARIFIRSWTPGDGLVCAFAKRAPRETPCGKPTAVAVTEDIREFGRRRKFRRVVCINHIPGLPRPGEIGLEARRAANERLAVAHWDEYQGYLDEETHARREKAFEFADPEIRRIVLGVDQETAS